MGEPQREFNLLSSPSLSINSRFLGAFFRAQQYACNTSCTAMHRYAPRCTAMHRDAPRCTAMHRDAPRCTAMHRYTPLCTAVHRLLSAGVPDAFKGEDITDTVLGTVGLAFCSVRGGALQATHATGAAWRSCLACFPPWWLVPDLLYAPPLHCPY
jgi:hypothetical protein